MSFHRFTDGTSEVRWREAPTYQPGVRTARSEEPDKDDGK
jgi:hypothetical protein